MSISPFRLFLFFGAAPEITAPPRKKQKPGHRKGALKSRSLPRRAAMPPFARYIFLCLSRLTPGRAHLACAGQVFLISGRSPSVNIIVPFFCYACQEVKIIFPRGSYICPARRRTTTAVISSRLPPFFFASAIILFAYSEGSVTGAAPRRPRSHGLSSGDWLTPSEIIIT